MKLRREAGAEYYPREEWGAKYGRGKKLRNPKPLDLVVVHHTWRPHLPADIDKDGLIHGDPEDMQTEVDALLGIEHYHSTEQPDKGWVADGISYQFLIFQSGRAYEGRGWGRVGAHTRGRNSSSVGISFVMNGDKHAPTPDAIASFNRIIYAGWSLGYIRIGNTFEGHQNFSAKSCPGEHVMREVVRPLQKGTIPT